MSRRRAHSPPRASNPARFGRGGTPAPSAAELDVRGYAIRRRGVHNAGDLRDYIAVRSKELQHGGCVCLDRRAERIWAEFQVMKNRSLHLETSLAEIRRALEDNLHGWGGSCDA